MLRKDYAYLFERFFYFLNSRDDDPMGYIVFDELDKSASRVLLKQVGKYFLGAKKGKIRSRLVSAHPLFFAIFILRDFHGRNARLVRGLNLWELVR